MTIANIFLSFFLDCSPRGCIVAPGEPIIYSNSVFLPLVLRHE